MKFIGLDLIANSPDASGRPGDPTERLSQTVENAVLFEELGFDGFAVGERHHAPFLSSAPPVVLSHIAAVTSRIRLFTGVTLLSVLDPVRVAEDYATLDHLSGGRIELIIGKGNGPEQAELFGIGRLEAWDTIAENYRLLRQLWSGHKVTWTPPEGVPSIRKTPLTDAEVHPQPLQPKIRIWHGSATAERSVELAAEFGDPVFSANGMNPVTRYAEWPWFGELAGRGHLIAAVHRGKSLLVCAEVARLLDPICRAEISRMRAADRGWGRLLDHLAAAGPSSIEDLRAELGLKRQELKALRAPLERCGAIVSRPLHVTAGHEHQQSSELARWDQAHQGSGTGEDPVAAFRDLMAAAVRAAVLAPETELRRWFSWPWYWSDSLVDDLIGQGRLRRIEDHVTVADQGHRLGEAPRPAASRNPA